MGANPAPDAVSPSPKACGVTVLRATNGRRATKQFKWNPTLHQWVKVSYSAGAWFAAEEHQVGNLDELVDVIDATRRDPSAFVVRGELAPWARETLAHEPTRAIRRRKHRKNGAEPPLVEAPRRWLMVDIDNWPLPTWADLSDDPERAIDAAVRELLPAAFHSVPNADSKPQQVRYFWQLSASAGFSAGVLRGGFQNSRASLPATRNRQAA